jgi:hypothetical protein
MRCSSSRKRCSLAQALLLRQGLFLGVQQALFLVEGTL